jgi:hypothetical protein
MEPINGSRTQNPKSAMTSIRAHSGAGMTAIRTQIAYPTATTFAASRFQPTLAT